MTHRFPPSLSSFRSRYRLTKRPSRLTWGTAIGTMLALAGVAVGASVSSSGARPANPAALGPARGIHSVHAGRADGQGGGLPLAASVGRASDRRAAVHHVGARQAAVRHAAVRRAAKGRSHRSTRARHLRPYRIFDSVTPTAIPAHRAVATYATGAYAVSRAQLAGRRTVFWIDTNGTDPNASILDVEPGDATPTQAATWAWHRLHAHPHALARIYTMLSWWPAVRAAVATLPPHMRSHIRWWIADPTGVPHLVPGSDATQWYWGHSYDISTATPRF